MQHFVGPGITFSWQAQHFRQGGMEKSQNALALASPQAAGWEDQHDKGRSKNLEREYKALSENTRYKSKTTHD